MPAARPLPRKHLSLIQDSISDLRLLAHRVGLVLERSEVSRHDSLRVILSEVQAACFATALRLTDIEVASGCDDCPDAPAATGAEIRLDILSRELSRLMRITEVERGPEPDRLFEDLD